MTEEIDVAVIGAGPAGASAALWLTRLGADIRLYEAANRVGGLLASSPFPNAWNVSHPSPRTGEQCARDMSDAISGAGVRLQLGSAVVAQREGGRFLLSDTNGRALARACYLVLATGTVPVDGGIAPSDTVHIGLAKFAATSSLLRAGSRIAVLGGGDTAIEAAMFALRHGAETSIFARSGIRGGHLPIRAANGADIHCGPIDVDPVASTVNGRKFDHIVVAFGFAANLAALSSCLRQDVVLVRGRIHVGPDLCSSAEGVFAIGDITAAMHPCSVTAMAQGVIAAKAIVSRLPGRSLTTQATAVV